MALTLLCWPTLSQMGAGGTAVVVEPSHQYPITCCCCVPDGSRGAVWHNGIWHGSMSETKACHWIPPCRKKWHLLTFINACWMFTETRQWVWAQWGGGRCVSAVVTVTVGHLCWCRFLWVWRADSYSLLTKHKKGWFVAESMLYQVVSLCSWCWLSFPWK